MNILILNPILYTAERNIIPNVDSIKDTMIYNMCIGFVALGHNITLCAAEEFRPQKREDYDFDVHFFRSDWTHFFPPSLLPFSKDLLHYFRICTYLLGLFGKYPTRPKYGIHTRKYMFRHSYINKFHTCVSRIH